MHNNQILTQNLYYCYYYTKTQVPNYWVLGPSGKVLDIGAGGARLNPTCLLRVHAGDMPRHVSSGCFGRLFVRSTMPQRRI